MNRTQLTQLALKYIPELAPALLEAYDVITEAHQGAFRNAKDFLAKSNLKAGGWNDYLQKELVYPWINTKLYGSRQDENEVAHRRYMQKKAAEIHAIPDPKTRIKYEKQLIKDHEAERKISPNTFAELLSDNKCLLFDTDFTHVGLMISVSDLERGKNLITSMDTYDTIMARVIDRILMQFNQYNSEYASKYPANTLRHKLHEKAIHSNNGLNRDPVIFLKTRDGKYSLVEGNHRTIEIIVNAVMGPLIMAYIGTKQPASLELFSKFLHSKQGLDIISNTKIKINAYVGNEPTKTKELFVKISNALRKFLA